MQFERSYMREPEYRGHRWSLTTILLATLAGAFVLQSVVGFYGGRRAQSAIMEYLALSPKGLARGFFWQFLTFQFLHSGFLHLALNGITIWFFGRPLEMELGPRRFLRLYVASGILGGVLQMIFQLSMGLSNRLYFDVDVVGASAGAFGLLAAYATMAPHHQITLLVFFVIPVTLKAQWLLWMSIGLALFGMLVPADNIAHAAHFGGILCGIAYVKMWQRGVVFAFPWRLPRVRWHRSNRPPPPNKPPPGPPQPSRVSATPVVPRGQAPLSPDFISREVDPILDKISAHGIQSLTERERKILEAARSRMARP
jgi:membrane associated rhomboid family serine protease